jgi:hypothetical protein
MDRVQTAKLPTISFFNKLILDSLGVWRGDVVNVEFDITATEEQRRKALSLAFEEHRNEDGTFGPISSVLKSMEELAPEGNVLQRKARTIQDIVQHFAKEEFLDNYELDELEPYIQGVIKEKFSDPLLSDFIINTRASLIQHYKEFVREFSPKAGKALDSYQFFISNIAVSVICKSLFTTLSNLGSPAELGSSVLTFNNKKEGTVWPLKAYLNELLERSQVSAYKLHQFHEIKLNNQVKGDTDIWKMISPSTLTNTKSKQTVGRFNRSNKMNWNIIWKQISPLVSTLSINENIIRLNSFVTHWIHNLAIYLESVLQNKVSFEVALSDIYKSTEFCKEKYIVNTENINLKPISDLLDDAESAEFENPALPIQTPYLRDELEIYRSYLASSECFDRKLLPEEFTNFWYLYSEENFNLKNQQALTKDVYASTSSDWIKHWCEARISVLEGDMTKALQDYKMSLSCAKYTSGRYFPLLYIDICAFCKSRYQFFSTKNEVDIFDRFYEQLGSNASKYSGLLGHTPSTMRDPETLLPYSLNSFKNGLILKVIDLTVAQMQVIEASVVGNAIFRKDI